jgi:UDP-galactopyranose mutase
MTDKNKYQILIVGAGISGSVLAQQYSTIGKRVLVIDKRNHIGGNCYDFFNKDGVMVSQYGAHLFHTNYLKVWQYLQKFSQWIPYKHKVLSSVEDKLVGIPVNIKTVNTLFSLDIKNSKEMDKWLSKEQIKIPNPKNSEEVALKRVGKRLYDLLFKNYTIKQWGKHPIELDSSVMARIPVRNNFNDYYFNDKYQAQPKEGFYKLFGKILDHELITVSLGVNFFDYKKTTDLTNFEKIFYSGPIDSFFDYNIDGKKLEYRSIDFQFETHDKEYFQGNSVINYSNKNKFTRIAEYKHITGQKISKTTISKEFPSSIGEPYYPVPTRENRSLYKKYKAMAKKLNNIYFIGRLAEYRYINMDEAFKNALDLFEKLEKNN